MSERDTPSLAEVIALKYRKRPVVVEAVQLDGSSEAFDAAVAFLGGASGAFNGCLDDNHPNRSWLYIDTPEGRMTAKNGDWIIKGVKGEFYPCKPDIFEATYEPTSAASLRDEEWLPIDSAPKGDGTILIGWGEYRERDGFGPAFMRWYDSVNGWSVNALPFYPTHWQPLPKPPTQPAAQERQA